MGVSSHAASVRALVDARLAELGDALDGYPARALLEDCTCTLDGYGASGPCSCALVDHVLTQWAERLHRDIEQLPPETMPVVSAIRQRMLATRDALLRLQALVLELADLQAWQHVRQRVPVPMRLH